MEKELRAKMLALVTNWKEINALVEDDTFNRETFEQVFDNTYDVLAPLSTVTSVDKEYMNLILEMRDFVSRRQRGLSEAYVAALVLTERVLYHCVVRPEAYIERVETACIYSMESREDIVLEFTKVGEAIDVLINVLKD